MCADLPSPLCGDRGVASCDHGGDPGGCAVSLRLPFA